MLGLQERNATFEGTPIRYWEGGSGPSVLMLHGSGAGASTFGNFKRVLKPLSERFHILAGDLVGFGKSGLRREEPYFDMDMWVRQAAFLAERLPAGPIGLIGHSLSGAIVLKFAATSQRICGVVTTGTLGANFKGDPNARGWTVPASREQLHQSVARTVFTKSLIDEEELDYRTAIIEQPGYREYFGKMFAHGRQYYIDKTALSEAELAAIQCPVLLMHGAQDESFTPEQASLSLVRSLPSANALVVGKCGHSVSLEYSELFVDSVQQFFSLQLR